MEAGGVGGSRGPPRGGAVLMLVRTACQGREMGVGGWGMRRKGTACLSPQSQPLSFTMCDISMMYFPSLYFWLVSKACSYFQPSVVLQLSQKISATEWSPVSRRRCSAGPQPTLTLSRETGGTQHPVGSLCQSSPPNSPKGLPSGELHPPRWEHPCLQRPAPLGPVPGPPSNGEFQFCPDSPPGNCSLSF